MELAQNRRCCGDAAPKSKWFPYSFVGAKCVQLGQACLPEPARSLDFCIGVILVGVHHDRGTIDIRFNAESVRNIGVVAQGREGPEWILRVYAAIRVSINETIDASVFERWRADNSYRPPKLQQ